MNLEGTTSFASKVRCYAFVYELLYLSSLVDVHGDADAVAVVLVCDLLINGSVYYCVLHSKSSLFFSL